LPPEATKSLPDKTSKAPWGELVPKPTLPETINPLLVCKMLLLSDRGNFNEIIYPNLYHKIYDKSLYKIYINDCFVSENNENTENTENKENTENTENTENNICDDEC
jgi:hypothetical protein